MKAKEKQKIGTLLDKGVIAKLKKLAAFENRPLNELLEDAVRQYQARREAEFESRKQAMQRFLNPGFKLPRREVDKILQEDYFGQ